ncbi:MAG: DUF6573 family protein [Rectinemataceae bacterium]|jgi:hypothetical protein
MLSDSSSLFGDLIYSYTRQQALTDGVLVDATDLAREAGFVFPVALTETLYHSYVVPALDLVAAGQSIQGRLWDLLFILRFAIAKARDTDTILFKVLFLMSADSTPIPVELISIAGPGDDGEPVLTIMLPDES